MEKLTNENIQFIDRYLKNSGVEFLDIRLEMTDHVASEIEFRMEEGDSQGFYSIFKEYMIANKASLLESLKTFKKEADRKVLLEVARNIYHPKTFIIAALPATGLYLLLENIEMNPDGLQLYFFFVMLVFYLILYLFFGKTQYLYLNRLNLKFGLSIYFMYMIYKHVPFFQDHSLQFFTVMILLNVAVLRTLFNLISYYKKNHELA